jgi:tripartite-type tricarboxylate transporter receptor subunit TctC
MTSRRKLLGTALGAFAAVVFTGPTQVHAAEPFPSKPIRFVVPFGPGSGTDTSARYYGNKLSELTGQPVVVENRPGGNGFIAVNNVLNAPADGYTVFIGSNSTLAVNEALFKKLPYDPIKDFSPLSMLMRSPAMLVVPGEAPYENLQQFLDNARKNPGKINFGAGSAGYRLMAELLNQEAGLKTVHVPYKGASEAITAVASGVVDYAFAEVTSVQQLSKAGKLRALAVASDKRVGASSSVPTATEAGLPGFEAYTWVAAVVPAKTPKEQTEKLAALFTQIANMPETKAFYDRIGASVMTGGPREMAKFQQSEVFLWKRIVTQAGVPQQ